jgi:N-acetylglucosaminyl-diphospho-decaprenol L-rhamnosyltransferase
MDLSAIIVNWNSGDYLMRLVDSLAAMKHEFREICIVDNASTDSSLEGLQQHPEVQVLGQPQNQGFARAANEGISRVDSSFLLLLNADVEVIPESVRQLYREIESRPRAAIVCGSLIDSGGRPQSRFQIRPFPDWKSVLSDVLFFDELLRWLRLVSEDEPSSAGADNDGPCAAAQRELRVEQPAAACWLLRKRAWEEIGGFDPRFYPAWFEDVDFCKRLRDAGWQIFYFPHLPFVHKGGVSLTRLSYPVFVRMFYVNLLKYLRKHHPYSYPVLWLPVQVGLWARRLLVRR